MKAIARRLRRLEDQLASANGKPRQVHRMMLRPACASLEGASCSRTLCRDGTVSESIVLGFSSTGRGITDDELEQWIEGFPIEVPDGRIHLTPIPPRPRNPLKPIPNALKNKSKKPPSLQNGV